DGSAFGGSNPPPSTIILKTRSESYGFFAFSRQINLLFSHKKRASYILDTIILPLSIVVRR
ncbi:MAG: hypothetical protein ACPG52_09735, partial [Cognaticolwellia sp.]